MLNPEQAALPRECLEMEMDADGFPRRRIPREIPDGDYREEQALLGCMALLGWGCAAAVGLLWRLAVVCGLGR